MVRTTNATIKEHVERIAAKNLEEEFKEINDIPNPENVTNNASNATHGFGELGRNFEFMMLKLAQLETLCELQQVEIESLKKTVKGLAEHVDHEDSVASLVQKDESTRMQEAQNTLKRVLTKHARQHKSKDFHPAPPNQDHKPDAQEKATEELLSEGAKLKQKNSWNVGGWINDAVQDTVDLGKDAAQAVKSAANSAAAEYEKAADKVAWVAQKTIDTVEMAVQILVKGFTDWNAGCANPEWPTMRFWNNQFGSGIMADWGKQHCWVRLMGQQIDLFNWNWGNTWVQYPAPIKKAIDFFEDVATCEGGDVFKCITKEVVQAVPPLNDMVSGCSGRNLFECFGNQIVSIVPGLNRMVTLGEDLVNCAGGSGAVDIIKCFGLRILQEVPPLSFLSRMGEILRDFIGTFAKIATTVVKHALNKGLGLVQTAATSAFPEIGAPPVVHHAGKNLVVKTHSQPAYQGTGVKEPKRMSTLQTGTNATQARGDDDEDDGAAAAITFQIEGYGPETTGLITQFDGKETATGSCLAFAPRNKTGAGAQATKRDWQVDSNDKFLQLEPWAVPCDNTWMQQNWDKWQGYTFYTSRSNIEKCLTVTFAMGLQPVAAFVGGLQFELLPTPFFEFDTQVCWPKHHPGGVDISVLRFSMRSAGIDLLSRTMRLTKRFGDDTDFAGSNLNNGTATYRSQLGLKSGSDVESGSAINGMSRTSTLLQTNSSHDEQAEEVAMQWADVEELYLASVEYGPHMSVNKTSELRGAAAHRRLSTLQSEPSKESYKLFGFGNPGLVSFDIEGLLTGSTLELGVKMGFGPFDSPAVRIPLLNIVDQFSAVLMSLPWVSASSRAKAEAALSDFSQTDVDDQLELRKAPADPSSMVAWFKSEDAGPEWQSAVGGWKGRVTKGSVTKTVEAGHGATKAVQYLTGNTQAGYDFGKIMKPDFTICSITRYLEEGQRERILSNTNPNFLHGHWEGGTGLAFYHTWVTARGGPGDTNWLVMCGNNNKVVFVGTERKNIAQHPGVRVDADFNLYINDGFGGADTEVSDFAVMEVITWNRALSEDEMWTSMEYLNSKLQAQLGPADPSSMVAWFRSEDAGPEWQSAVGGWKGRVTKGSVTKKVEVGHGATKAVQYLTGNTQAGYDFGKIMKPDFTICSITRYLEEGQKERILTSRYPNFVHGHWKGGAEIAYYGAWVTSSSGPGDSDWLVMCGNNNGVVYFAGTERKSVAQHPGVRVDADFNLYINDGFGSATAEVSDFAVMEVITWNRALSEDEMWTSMEYLNSKL
ncbi:unnamed protein product [Symbiodinium sp. CCMP2592]|nr:unnamed protein product [Symbiodinium sp. CCMP2592]